jgi:uncharacterized membrane protein YeaQ/YmgE (transglycosylase-associated protein family)
METGPGSSMRNRIFGIIGVLLGGAILLSFNFIDDPPMGRTITAGEIVIGLFGAVLFLAGLESLFKQDRS